MKQIKEYPEYKVGADGTIISYKCGKITKLKPQLVTQSEKKYLQVGLYNKHNRRNEKGMKVPKMLYIHRIVWETFVGEIPSNLEIDHKDENPHNCSLRNLRLMSRKQNVLEYHRNKRGVVYSESGEEMYADYLILKRYRLVAQKWNCCIASVSRGIFNYKEDEKNKIR